MAKKTSAFEVELDIQSIMVRQAQNETTVLRRCEHRCSKAKTRP